MPLKSGDPAPVSGDYDVYNADGTKVQGRDPVTIAKGKPMPPTPKSNQTFRRTRSS